MRRRQPKSQAPDVALVAGVVQRLAVLLSAGVAPAAAWGYLREGDFAARVAAVAARGRSVPDAIVAALDELSAGESRRGGGAAGEEVAWRGLAMAWAVATDAGAPLAPTLRAFAESLRGLAQAQRDIRVALTAPAATAKMVMFLPIIGVLFGMALGFNTLETLTTTPVGLGCVAVGTVLLVAAARWNRALVRAAQPRDLAPGLHLDLAAIAVSGGGALDRARASVDRAVTAYGLPGSPGPLASAATPAAEGAAASGIDAVLDLSRRAGVPAGELLRSEAEEERRAARAEVQERAEALSVRLMLPLGLCILPAFMVLGVLPLLVTVVTSTTIGS